MRTGLGHKTRGQGPRVGLVHGFTQNRNCWGAFADHLAEHFETVLVDAPGHGESSEVAADLPTGAALIGDAVGSAHYVGYSMGGRHVLRLALDHPELVQRMVLVGASPGLDDRAERAARVDADERLARHLETIGVAAFIDEWLAQPLFAGLPDDARFVEERRANTVIGLATSLRLAGTGAQEPLWDRLADLATPTLLVVGADDQKFAQVATRMQQAMGGRATIVTVPESGHVPHLETPNVTAIVVEAWLREQQ